MTAKSSGREKRLAAALRENLKRRKARDRALAEASPAKVPEEGEPRPNKAAKTD